MNIRTSVAAMALLCTAGAASAGEPIRTLQALKAQGVLYVAECDHRVLPSQRQVGEWTGLHNFSQVYDARARLMGEIGRACRTDGIEQVQVVSRDADARDTRLVAVVP